MAVRRRGLEFNIQGRDRTGRAFASVKRNLREVGALALRAAKGVAAIGTAAAAGFAVLVKRSLDAADNIAKVADSIGISTDALQEYRFAADLSGVSTEALDSGFQAFAKRIGELRAGTGTLLTFLNKMDPAFAGLVQRADSTEEALDLLLKKIGSFESQSDRAALSAAAFGRSAGVDMTNLVRGGTEALEEMRRKARDLGLVMSEDLLRNAETTKDQLTLLAAVIKTKVTVEILKLAPEIGRLAERFTEGLPKLIAWVRQFGEWAGLLDKIAPTKLQRVAAAIEAINKAQAQRTGAFGRGPSDRAAEIERRDALTRQLNDLIELQDKFAGMNDLGTGGGTGGGAVDPPQVEKGTAAIERQTQVLGSLTRGTQLMIERRQGLTTVNAAAVETENKLIETEDKLAGATQALGFSFASAFENAIVNGERFQDVLKGILQDILRIAARLAVSEPLARFLSGLFTAGAGTGTEGDTTGGTIRGPTDTSGALSIRSPGAAANVKLEVIDRNNNAVDAQVTNVDRGGVTMQIILDAVAADKRRGGVTAQADRDVYGLRPVTRQL